MQQPLWFLLQANDRATQLPAKPCCLWSRAVPGYWPGPSAQLSTRAQCKKRGCSRVLGGLQIWIGTSGNPCFWMRRMIFGWWFPQTFHYQLKPKPTSLTSHQAENVLQLFNLGIVLTRFACSRDLTWSLIQSILCFRFVSDQQVLHQAENVLQLFNSGIVLTRFACSRDLNWSQIQSILCFRFVSDWRLFPIIA